MDAVYRKMVKGVNLTSCEEETVSLALVSFELNESPITVESAFSRSAVLIMMLCIIVELRNTSNSVRIMRMRR